MLATVGIEQRARRAAAPVPSASTLAALGHRAPTEIGATLPVSAAEQQIALQTPTPLVTAADAPEVSPTESVLRRIRHRIRAAAVDLYRTGHLSEERAKRLAEVATIEALRRDIPPALLIGVMRVENETFRSGVRSGAKATGLMQVMPFWLRDMRYRYGSDLSNDTTNIRMGASILAIYLKEARGDWREALLRYNGCKGELVSSSCLKYPDKVHRAVLRDAAFSCGGQAFDSCIAQPLVVAFARPRLTLPPGQEGD